MSLFDSVKSLNLPVGDFAIFGSGPLIVRGIIPASNDLDIICRGQAWERVKAIGELEYLSKYDVTVVTMCGGRLTFGTKWAIGEFDIDELIDGAEEIDGLPFVRLEHVTSYKEISKRPKDLRHIEALRAYQLTL
jgi:predicted nucleotidyltransferase